MTVSLTPGTLISRLKSADLDKAGFVLGIELGAVLVALLEVGFAGFGTSFCGTKRSVLSEVFEATLATDFSLEAVFAKFEGILSVGCPRSTRLLDSSLLDAVALVSGFGPPAE